MILNLQKTVKIHGFVVSPPSPPPSSFTSQTASAPLVPSFGRKRRGCSQKLTEKPVACLVSTWLGPKDPNSCASWVSQQLIPLLPRCSADSGDLLNPMLLAYWAALYAFCFVDTKCFSCSKSYLESLKVKNYRDSKIFSRGFFSVVKQVKY